MNRIEWEYSVRNVDSIILYGEDHTNTKLENALNELGKDGWEVMSVTHVDTLPEGVLQFRVISKRPPVVE